MSCRVQVKRLHGTFWNRDTQRWNPAPFDVTRTHTIRMLVYRISYFYQPGPATRQQRPPFNVVAEIWNRIMHTRMQCRPASTRSTRTILNGSAHKTTPHTTNGISSLTRMNGWWWLNKIRGGIIILPAGGEGGFALVRFKPPSFSFSLPPAIYIHYIISSSSWMAAVIQFKRIHERGIGSSEDDCGFPRERVLWSSIHPTR